ncbi:hypothetical protein [Mucilaginibacter sp.]|jgi:hypothetical protein|uniref:hypothetical protein n=1 Tax=Mucilaginibacter sp. TaxID=1882438 RepID=UPI003565DBB0
MNSLKEKRPAESGAGKKKNLYTELPVTEDETAVKRTEEKTTISPEQAESSVAAELKNRESGKSK